MSKKIKRFYKVVEVVGVRGGFVVELDRRAVKSPGRNRLILPSRVLAEKLATEWRQQSEFIVSSTMPFMHFVSMISDHILADPKGARAEILKYAGSDLLCYRVDEPRALAERQEQLWQPVLLRFKKEVRIELLTSNAIRYVEQNKADMKRMSNIVEQLEEYELGAVYLITVLTGSALLAIALYKNWLTREQAWKLAHLDEDFQAEQWGSDDEERQRRQLRYADYCAAALVFEKQDY